MVTTRLLTAEDMLEMAPDGQRCDLIRGELHCMAAAGGEHGEIEMDFGSRLAVHVRERGLGRVYGAETGFMLNRDPDTIIAPDVAYVRADRLPPRSQRRGFLALPPDLVVEVLSPSNRAGEIRGKIHDYLQGGVPLVVIVDPRQRTIESHTPGQPIRTFQEDEEWDAGDILPGFRLAVADLFRD